MRLVNWEPFGDVDLLFNRLMPSAFARWPEMAFDSEGGKKVKFAPSADISETNTEYVIRAELPAVKKEDVQVTLEDGVITVKGERRQQFEDKSEKFHRTERFYGMFERSFALPDNIKGEAIRCESKDGVLTVHIPKMELVQPKPTQITVQ
jgi:HSP20 family protein